MDAHTQAVIGDLMRQLTEAKERNHQLMALNVDLQITTAKLRKEIERLEAKLYDK